jgi:hypothetical protein
MSSPQKGNVVMALATTVTSRALWQVLMERECHFEPARHRDSLATVQNGPQTVTEARLPQ